METKSANHEIKLHKKHCQIFGKNSLIPYLYSEGIIKGIPFSDKQSDMKKYRYLIMESINNPTELSDYIRSNCKKVKNKDINPYYLILQIFYCYRSSHLSVYLQSVNIKRKFRII